MRSLSLPTTALIGQFAPLFIRVLSLSVFLVSTAEAQTFPATLDLRSAGPGGDAEVAAIQDQSNVGDCWSFATTTALDSNLIMNGYLPTSTTPPAMAISSWHLSAYNGASQNTAAGSDGDYDGMTGGWNWMATAYYTRGQGSWAIPQPTSGDNITTMSGGPVLNSNDPLNVFPTAAANREDNLAPYLPPIEQPQAFTVTGAYYYDQAGSGRSSADQIAAVKQAITTYGAVATYMYAGGYTLNGHDDSVFHYDPALGYEYEYNPTTKASDHVVTIIGWDDTITLPNQTTAGAWIVQNSWGAWGGTLSRNDGTFYAPYTDPYVGVAGVTAFNAVPAGKYSPFVLQNELGPTADTGNSNNPTGMGVVKASKATIALSNMTVSLPGTLLAVGLTSLDAQPGASKAATINIFNGYTIVGGVGTPGTLLETDNILFTQEGYTVFDLNTPLSLFANEQLTFVIDYEGSDIPYVWESSSDSGADAPTGLTYFYDTSDDLWKDFATFDGTTTDSYYDGAFSVKGLLAVPEPSVDALLLLSVVGVLGWRRMAMVRRAVR